jgi:CRP/FNR family transcriptional regulator, cyclic AMP receptor protein
MTSTGNGSWPVHPAGRIALLDVDPDLAGSAAPAEANGAGRLTVSVFRLASGPMPEPPRRDDAPHLGYLILKGLLLYEVSVYGRATAELLGPGDLVRPWSRQQPGALTSTSKWIVLEQALLGDLGPVKSSRLANGHDIVETLLARSADRVEAAAIQRSIAAHVRVDVRVLAYLWHLADRFGVVVPGAVRLNVPLTHAVLARLVGARRPTVTTALQRLMQLGYLRRENRAFVLFGDAGAVEELESRSPARDFAMAEDGYVAAGAAL